MKNAQPPSPPAEAIPQPRAGKTSGSPRPRPVLGHAGGWSIIATLALSLGLTAATPEVLKPLGMGLGGYAYWSSGPFANTALSGGDWLEYGPSEWGTSVSVWQNPQFDENGYPKYLNGNRKLRLLVWPYGGNYSNRPATWPMRNRTGIGKWVVTWRGDADIRLNGNRTFLAAESTGPSNGQGSVVDGRRVYLFSSSPGSNHITIEAVNPDNPVTDLKIWLPDPEDPMNRSLEGQFWHPTYLARLRDLDLNHVRTMDWGDTNASPQQDWGDRRLPTFYGMHGRLNPRAPATGITGNRSTGIAWEYMISLANELGKDLWICVPHLATETYVTKLAQLMRYGSDGREPYTSPQANPVYPPLREDLRLYVEYSNEIWSSGSSFPQGNWAQERASALQITKPQFNARRFCQIWHQFEQVFGGHERLVRVAAIWTGSSSYTTPFLQEIANYGPTLSPPVTPDIIAPTTYFGNGIQDWAFQTALDHRGTSEQWFLTAEDFPSGSQTRPVSVPANDPYWTSAKFDQDLRQTFLEWKRRIFSGSSAQGGGPDATGIGGGFDDSLRTSILQIFGREVPLVSYEGGPSLYADYYDGGDNRDDGITTFLDALNRRPEFAQVYRIQLNMAVSKGLRTHGVFVDHSAWGKYGQWGHLEYLDQLPHESVKWSALMTHETEMARVRHIYDTVGTRPTFTTPGNLPAGVFQQPYSALIEVAGGETSLSQPYRFDLIGGLLVPGLSLTPDPAHPSRLHLRGVPLAGGPNYLYLRVLDRDGDAAWQVFDFYVAGGPGTLVESDFTGQNPAMNLPWTRTLTQDNRIHFGGWRRGATYSSSGGTVGGRGVNVHQSTQGLRFSVSQGSANESDSTLASALADDEYWAITLTPLEPVDLRQAEVRLTYLRHAYHAPRRWSIFCSLSGFSSGQELYTTARTTSENTLTEYVFRLPDSAAYSEVGSPFELRFYPYGSQYGHQASIVGFKLTAKPSGPPPSGLELWRESFSWPGGMDAPHLDPDQDGVPNLLEYALGSHPLLPATVPGFSARLRPGSQGFSLSLSRIGDPRLTYRLESSATLQAGAWDLIWSSSGYANEAGFVEIDLPLEESPRFVRLRVDLGPE